MSNAKIKIDHLTGIDRVWVALHRQDGWFITNKVCSVLLASALALYTASLKPDLLQYKKDYPDATNINSYNFIYWLMFIYYAFQALDQLIELYAGFLNREKGALGLLLEMNNFMGIGLVIYLTIFNFGDRAEIPEEFSKLRSWVGFQSIFMYISIAISFLMYFCFRSMHSKLELKESPAAKESKEE